MSNLQTALERALPIVAAAYGEQFGVKVVLSGTDACTDGETIILPAISSFSELKDVLFGYLAHEAAHVRDTKFEVMSLCKNALEKSFLNLIEDVRIERLIQDVFPGTQFTLDAMWTHIVEESMSPPARPEDNEASQLHQYLLHKLQSDTLSRKASDALAELSREVIEQTFPVSFMIRLDGLLGKYVDNLSDTQDCLNLVRAILKALREAEDEEKKGESTQEQNQQGGESQQCDQDQGGGGTGGDTQDNSDSKNGNADSSSGDNASQGNGNSQKSNADNDGNDQPSGQSNSNESNGQDKGDQSSNAQSQLGETGGNEQTTGGNSASLHDRVSNETDLPKEAIEQLKAEMVTQARVDNNEERFSIDTSTVGGESFNNGDTGSLSSGILASSTIRSRLLGLLQAQTRSKEYLHSRGKRVDGKRLTRLAAGDSRVFVKREEFQRPNTSVHVLLDCSGSMKKRQVIANQASVSLALAISSIPKCDIAVSMFPGINGDVSPLLRRKQPVRASMGKFAVSSSGGTPLAEAMLFAARELTASKGQRKVLIIVTDGAPSDGRTVRYMNDLLAGHVDTYAIGINSDSVKNYFDKWSVISDVKELQKALFDVAGEFLQVA